MVLLMFRFFEVVVTREQRRNLRMWWRLSFVDVQAGEFLCPLCKRLSNAVLPLLPPLNQLVLDWYVWLTAGAQAEPILQENDKIPAKYFLQPVGSQNLLPAHTLATLVVKMVSMSDFNLNSRQWEL